MADADLGAVRRTARQAPDDHAEIIVPVAQPDRGTTNPGSAPVDADAVAGDGTGDLTAKLIEDARRAISVEPEAAGESGADQWYVSDIAVDCDTDTLLRVLAQGLIAAGWRPPLPTPACTCEYPYDGAPGSGHHPGCDVFGPPQPAAPGPGCYPPVDGWDGVAAPRVFFPGDTVPAGVWTVAEGNGRVTSPNATRGDRTARFTPKLEVPMPTLQEFHAAIKRAEADHG